MSALFGRDDPLLGQCPLPPLAGRGVGRGAQVDQRGGEATAGGLQGAGGGTRLRQEAGGPLAGPFGGRQGVPEAVMRPGGS